MPSEDDPNLEVISASTGQSLRQKKGNEEAASSSDKSFSDQLVSEPISSLPSSGSSSSCLERMDVAIIQDKTPSKQIPSEIASTKKPSPQESLEERRRNWKKRRPRRSRRPKPYAQRNQQQQQQRRRAHSDFDARTSESLLNQDEEKRAKWIKLRMIHYGKPYAPYNTTQFLMEDQNVREPEVTGQIKRVIDNESGQREEEEEETGRKSRNESFSTRDGSESDEYYSSPDDERDFQQKQFSEIYETVHAERISSMSKRDLVQEFLLLEEKAEDLEKKLKDAKSALSEITGKHTLPLSPSSSPPPPVFDSKEEEVTRLRAEVSRLMRENQRLRSLNPTPPSTQTSSQDTTSSSSPEPSSSSLTTSSQDNVLLSTLSPIPVSNQATVSS